MTRRSDRARRATDAERLLEVFFAGKAEATARAYRHDLQDFAAFLGADGPPPAVAELFASSGRASELAALYKGRLRKDLAPASVNRRLATLRSLVRTAQAIGLVDWRLTVPAVAARRLRDVAGPGRDAVRRMMAAAINQGGLQGARDMALLHLLYGLALRRSEIVGLDLEHVDLGRPAVAVLGKGRAEREWMALPLRTQEALAAYVAMRGQGPGPLFLTLSRARRGGRLTGAGLYVVVAGLGRAAGCRATPHAVRHTAITDAILRGHSLADVQRFSRHRDLRTLQHYYDALQGVALEVGSDLTDGISVLHG